MSSKVERARKKDTPIKHQEGSTSAKTVLNPSTGTSGEQVQAQRPTVLVVDDNPDILEYLSKLLEKQFLVSTAADGRACLDKASAEPPSCIVTDINMPHLSGIDTIKVLRRDPRLGHIPIIAMSAYGNWAAAKALEAGATIVMLKPLEPDDFIENIRNLVNGSYK
jgi:CheY-like chemotaxis protein